MTQTLTQMRKELESSGENGDSNRSAKAGPKRDKRSRKVTAELRDAAHNPEVVGSNPSPATKSVTVVDTISTTVIFCLLLFRGCFGDKIRDIPNIFSHKQILRPDLIQPWAEKTGLGIMVIVIRI